MSKQVTVDGRTVTYETVSDLIAALGRVPGDTLVILAKDAEGNGYSPWSQLGIRSRYEPDSTWSGELVDPEGPDYNDQPRSDEDKAAIVAATHAAVVLWPVN